MSRINFVSAVLAQLTVVPSYHVLTAQCPDGSPPPCRAQKAPSAPSPNSVAVLYFESQSPDTSDAFLAAGLTEEIIQTLSGITRLQIQNRYSVRRFRDRPPHDLAEVGRALNVSYVVTGTVRRSGPRIRITAELTRAGAGVQVWGERYDRALEDILDIQEEIARQVATGIVGRLIADERTALGTPPTRDAEAYRHYLRGNFYLDRREPEFQARAVEEYRAALQRDRTYAPPLGRLAYAYALALAWKSSIPGVPDDSILAAGLRLADQAVRQAPRDPEGWLGLGYLRVFADPIAYTGAREALRRAVELDPGDPEAWHQYGSALADLNEDSLAAEAFQRALQIDSTRAISWVELSFLSTVQHRYEESLRLLDHAVAVEPEFFFARYHRALVLLLLGDTARARAESNILSSRPGLGSDASTSWLIPQIVLRSGDPEAIAAVRPNLLAQLAGIPDTLRNEDADDFIQMVVPTLLALGERDRALTILESARPRGRSLRFWLRWPSCDPLHADPRFQRLVEMAGR